VRFHSGELEKYFDDPTKLFLNLLRLVDISTKSFFAVDF